MLRIVTIAFFLIPVFGNAQDCDFLLKSGNYSAILKQIQILNPEIFIRPNSSPAEMYLALKRESERIARDEISTELSAHLRATQSEHFAVDTLISLTIFYRNALYALEQRAANLWRQQEVRSLAGRPLSPEMQNFAEHLLDTFFSPNTLNDQSLTSEEVQIYFRERPWMKFRWDLALETVGDWMVKEASDSVLNLKTKPTLSAFNSLVLPSSFDWNQQNQIRVALSRDKRVGACCLSEPGCTLCPHNRGVLRR